MNAGVTLPIHSVLPPPLSAGGRGAEKFLMLAKRGGLALFEFLRGGE